MSKDVWARDRYRWPRRRRSFKEWWADRAWRQKRKAAKTTCITTGRHEEEDQMVRGVAGARVWYCRRCLHMEWID